MTKIDPQSATPTQATASHMLQLLVCPITKTTLRYDADTQCLISDAAKLAFPIRDGIPILLIDEATRL